MKSMHKWFSFIPMFLIAWGLLQVNLHHDLQIVSVESKSADSTFYLSGIVKPLRLSSVYSPVEGIVTEAKIPYGQWVKKKALLYSIDSPKLAESYRQNVEAIIKAIRGYQGVTFQNNGNKELFKLGLISKIAFMDNTQQLRNSELDLYEAETKLAKMLDSIGEKMPALQNISETQLQNSLKKNISKIKIYAPEEGYLLFPSRSIGGGDSSAPTSVGSTVKEGQTLAYIGAMNGIYIDLMINEMELKNFYIGQKANITGPAFAKINLEGAVKNISRQTSAQDDSPTYAVVVWVPTLTKVQRETIVVGMSAEVAFTQKNPSTLWVPIVALNSSNGSYFVKKLNSKSYIEKVMVVPGSTDESSIQILQGLSAGDKIVLPN